MRRRRARSRTRRSEASRTRRGRGAAEEDEEARPRTRGARARTTRASEERRRARSEAARRDERGRRRSSRARTRSPTRSIATGVLDVLTNGSGFLRLDAAGQSRDDVYVSPAQIRRCELRAGDEVSGPVRPPRRNERHPSLVRVETVNGADAEPPEERPWFGDLTPVFPTERLAAPAAFEAAPFGHGSRVAVSGPARGGREHAAARDRVRPRRASATSSCTVVLVGRAARGGRRVARQHGARRRGRQLRPLARARRPRPPSWRSSAPSAASSGASTRVRVVDSLDALPRGRAAPRLRRGARHGGGRHAHGLRRRPATGRRPALGHHAHRAGAGRAEPRAPKVAGAQSGTLRADRSGQLDDLQRLRHRRGVDQAYQPVGALDLRRDGVGAARARPSTRTRTRAGRLPR